MRLIVEEIGNFKIYGQIMMVQKSQFKFNFLFLNLNKGLISYSNFPNMKEQYLVLTYIGCWKMMDKMFSFSYLFCM